ncbi:hypothetical protein PC118_g9548 [Phytophthora cactorum]|uniref:Uncharacterized protein n=1 Tax=Phytophthora cactorum TaxID=29920 RepID=A0A8T1FUZ9_9STRA|nr:hypothetical protein PC112_g9809 [Phytophthora cactorum]KAG2827114.1 hypothetical protein PC111_g8733 [Phytophthora cactorum]KAG2983176.1 hypothetical protein PC118_g9548 [Phytophthora cactorum]
MARLEGRSLGERQRLSMEHRAYLNGERDADADFGPEESHLETATSAAGTTSLSSTTEPRPLARPPSPRPPLGKDACYLARKAAEAKKKRAAGKKKMTKRQEAALRREEKKAKDERVRARAGHAASARSVQKKNERERATLEEQRVDKLEIKLFCSYRQRLQPNGRDADADDEGAQGTQGSAGRAPPSDEELSATGPPREIETGSASFRQAARSLCMDSTTDDDREDSGAMQEAPVTRSPDGAALNSDVEGDIESDDWYTETKVTTTSGICSGGEDAVTQHAGEEEDVDCDPSEDNEGGTDGDALLLREKNRAKRQQLRERLAAAKAKLSRDWATTTKNWDALTSVEMEALALDEEALKKLRVYGWNFGTFFNASDPDRGLSWFVFWRLPTDGRSARTGRITSPPVFLLYASPPMETHSPGEQSVLSSTLE